MALDTQAGSIDKARVEEVEWEGGGEGVVA